MNRPRLEETPRGLTVRTEERYLYSKYNPAGNPVRAALAAPIRHRCIYIVPSPLLGYGLPELSRRIPEDSIILTIEQSQELLALCTAQFLKNTSTVNQDTRIINVRLSDKASLHSLLYSQGPWRFRRVQRVDLSGGAALKPGLYDELTAFLMEDLMSYWRNRHALDRLGREWIRHILANISEMSRGEIVFKDVPDFRITKIPLVAGAGPSLEESMDFIRRNREGLWVLAVDTALPALSDGGITADAAVVLDTQAWNYLDFHDTGGCGMPVFADITAYPPCLSHTGGPCYFFSSDFAELDFLKRLDVAGFRDFSMPPLGSVGLAALEIAGRISGSAILITGLDFAYSPGKSHARSSSFHRWQISSQNRLNPHPGWQASIKRPRVKGRNAFGDVLNSDAVLQGYAALLKDRYSSDDRFHVLEPGGLDLGIPVIGYSRAEQILHEARQKGVPEMKPSGGKSPFSVSSPARDAALFLKAETERFSRVITAWEDYAAGTGSAGKVSESLEGLDEVFADFPDQPPLPKEDDSFLVRGVSRVRQLQRYIERIGS